MSPRGLRRIAGFLAALIVMSGCAANATAPEPRAAPVASAVAPAAATATTPHPSEAARGGGVTAGPAPARPFQPSATPTTEPADPTLTPATPPPPTPAPTSVPPPAWAAAPHKTRDSAPPAVQAKAAVLIDAGSGAVLYDKDAHLPLPPASTTKILTLLLALERGNPDDEVTVELDNRTYWGSAMGLINGDRFTLRDLMYGLMLPSGNDAAYAIARHIAGSETAFAGLMNERMRELGLHENHFRNASGLGRAETGNVVSAYDLAQLSRVAMTNPEFARIAGARSWVARGSRTIAMGNGNELLYRYPGADGVKIGWGGSSAGQTVVGSAVRGGHRLIAVLLNTPDRPGEAGALLTWGFATHEWLDGR